MHSWTSIISESIAEHVDECRHSVYERIDENCLEREQLEALKNSAEAQGRWSTQCNSTTYLNCIHETVKIIEDKLLANQSEDARVDAATYINDVYFLMGMYKGAMYK